MGDLWGKTNETEPYIEQAANVALAVNESLVQDYDGLLRIAPALPPGWDADGTEYIHGGSTVSVQVHGGVIGTVGIHAGSTGIVTMRNPWPGQSVEVVDGTDESTVVVAPTTASQFSIPTTAGNSYLVQPVAAPVSGMTFAQLTGVPATTVSHLGTVRIGIDRTGPAGPITGINGLCVDDSGASTSNGNPIVVWGCSGAANQQWTVGTDGTLRTLGKCMDITGGGKANGTKIELWDCNGGANQVWQAQADGTLKNPQSGRCLDDSGAGPAGTQLIIWDCSASANQQWHLP
ncbi:hypothetical protein DN069_11500 [Streptacidiphilus pinicola]|uniref:Ricin B lectin domain-containing protein n=2 Tax=Streptacidiphilus pinicola TaxID=2219663 RepID=A0A2X0IQX1_9ACTN|nr:hypothetical protein DN069_11500 [Streptacidiphilus pinicola]